MEKMLQDLGILGYLADKVLIFGTTVCQVASRSWVRWNHFCLSLVNPKLSLPSARHLSVTGGTRHGTKCLVYMISIFPHDNLTR